MLPLLLFLLPFSTSSEACQIDVPIGIWLKKDTNRSCETVKGHFILDRSANSQTRAIYRSFEKLRRIEGCIHVKGYTGSRNLSFFSKLEEVICDKTAAKAAKLKNVIHVHEPYLHTMGFDSLRNVTGPGEIYLSFEDYQQTYGQLYYEESYKIEGQACFSKKEMVFLARHPQFIGKMYRACETDDPCFRPELFKDFYTVEDIPENCTTFVGFICLAGPYPDDLPVFKKFKNLTLLIGVLQIGPNLFTSLVMFSNLEVVYPYQTGSPSQGCYGDNFNFETSRGLQPIAIGLSRFLKNISLPSLKPVRPLEVNEPFSRRPISQLQFTHSLYFPDNNPDPCEHFPQFGNNCRIGYQYNLGLTPLRPDPYVGEAWLAGAIFVAIGLVFGKRCIVTLFTGQLKNSLPKSRYFIATVILITILSATEAVIINQRTYETGPFMFSEIYVFSVFSIQSLLHPSAQLVIRFLAVCRQTSLIILILCYPDVILSYRWKRWNPRFSLFYIIFASILIFIAFFYFNFQLLIATRTLRPHYGDPEITFMAFVLNIDGQENFTIWLPRRVAIPDRRFMASVWEPDLSTVDLLAKDMPLEVIGAAFPEISLYCDVIFTIFTIAASILQTMNQTRNGRLSTILIVLYLQMSMNRIRGFLHFDILSEEMNLDGLTITVGQFLAGRLSYSEWTTIYDDPYWTTDEDLLWIMIRIVEKLPYFSFVVASFLCWKYLLYYRYLGMALIYRETKRKEESSRLGTDCVSDISSVPKIGKN